MSNGSTLTVSVIIPVMNVEKFLAQCLESICAQTYPALEIICLNDGSTDASLEIIERFAEHDDRIIVIDKKNEGYGATCNRGIGIASGEWISIIEPDDWVDPTMYSEMIDFATKLENATDTKIDIVKTPWIDVVLWDDPDAIEERSCYLDKRISTSKSPFTLEDEPVLIEGHPAIWSALYRRDFLNKENIRFVAYPGAGWADNPFLIDTLIRANAIAYLDKPFYHYRCDLPGSTFDHNNEEKIAMPFNRWLDMIDILDDLGIKNEEILKSHYFRGFKYIEGAIKDDGWDNPVVQDGTRKIFTRMDPELIKRYSKISPKQKKFFSEVSGHDATRSMDIGYTINLIKEGTRSLRSKGLKGTLGQISKYSRIKNRSITDNSHRDEELLT